MRAIHFMTRRFLSRLGSESRRFDRLGGEAARTGRAMGPAVLTMRAVGLLPFDASEAISDPVATATPESQMPPDG
jgi:hypothetical protein